MSVAVYAKIQVYAKEIVSIRPYFIINLKEIGEGFGEDASGDEA